MLVTQDVIGQKNINISYEVADFFHFKNGAVSFTFDDGVPNQFTIGKNILDKFNFKGTFFINPGFVGEEDWKKMREMVISEHEIGAHTMTHPHLKEINLDRVRIEIEQSKKTIEQNIDAYQCLSFAYPFGESNESIREITSMYFQGARTTTNGHASSKESYYFGLPIYYFISNVKLKDANKQVNGAIHNNKWLIETFHGFDGEGYEPISSDLFLKHLQYIKAKENYLWVTTFGDAIKYFKEHLYVKIRLTDSSFNSFNINITDCLPDSIYDFPLTFRFKISKQWADIKVFQNNINIISKLETDACNNQYIVFDAIPDRGEVSIVSGKVINQDNEKCISCKLVAFPNPFNQMLSILSEPLHKGTIQVYNCCGTCLFKGEMNSEVLKIDTSLWGKGVYIVTIKFNGTSNIIKRAVVKQ